MKSRRRETSQIPAERTTTTARVPIASAAEATAAVAAARPACDTCIMRLHTSDTCHVTRATRGVCHPGMPRERGSRGGNEKLQASILSLALSLFPGQPRRGKCHYVCLTEVLIEPRREKIKYWFLETNNFTEKRRIASVTIASHVQFYELNALIS